MITVIGSANIDVIAEAENFPVQGETVRGRNFQTAPGGKGANQAVACARLGEEVQLIGSVGSDEYGSLIMQNLHNQNVGIKYVQQIDGPSGVAVILLTDGDNRIISIPGANHALIPERIGLLRDVIRDSDLIMMQLEIPIAVVWRVLILCKELQVPVMMDPAPSSSFHLKFMPYLTYVTPNETECFALFGTSIEEAAARYPNQLLVTLGSRGVCYHDGKQLIHVDAIPAKIVDTTGAGDTFNGALASQLACGHDLQQAIQFANAAASLSIEKFGAQGGMPDRPEVFARLGGKAEEDRKA
ncbi:MULTISPECIES: ribokinase [Sporosarcina]|uniref:ribokinase n=1 Tax=Sporosarcina TaxID=1569 RepID=UPI00129AAEF8|nr:MULTISPECIES: ribokinase [Sporosarcina]GKV66102.1 ribokinase [Sporosarcina sp. NCCP-2331]GLB56140.1 ribokinase [Sporosarcina sp. NCCP-2378]